MHNPGDQHAISIAQHASSDSRLDAASSAVSSLHPDRPKVHVVHARRQSDVPRDDGLSTRVKPLALTSVFGVLYLLAMAVFYQQGLIDALVLKAAIALVAGLAAFFYACFGWRWNQRFKDKSLRLPITLCLIGMMLTLLYLSPQTHILFLPFLFLMMAFAMHRVPPRTVLALSLVTLAGYAGVILLHRARGVGAHMLQLECMQLLALCLTLPGFTVLASRVQHLHNALFKATRKIRDIEEDARRDVLLGCFNRRYIVAAIEQQKRLADESGQSLCLAVMDLDHFKRVNDEAGHLGGDEVLRSFARIAQDNIREHDIFGRYGGEEFLLILPDTSLLAALNVAERIREQVEHFSWDGKLRNRVTVSIGLTQYIPGESVLDLFSRTDTAMYMAKQGGRNQVVVEEPAADQPVMA
ncbi:MAG TPA: GGDEF domain-containing protein [Oxalicibacterium sp.]|nr:GGDEF domain-containing protein [Oxalicibacterium sp.]